MAKSRLAPKLLLMLTLMLIVGLSLRFFGGSHGAQSAGAASGAGDDGGSGTAVAAARHPASTSAEMAEARAGSRAVSGLPLQLSERLKWQFDDLILAADGDESLLPGLLHRLATELNLSEAATDDLLALFGRYRDYLMTLGELKARVQGMPLSADDSQSLVREAQRLQYLYFSEAEIAAFFADANRYDEQVQARLAAMGASGGGAEGGVNSRSLRQSIDMLPDADRAVLLPTQQAMAISESLAGASPGSEDITLSELNSEQLAAVAGFRSRNQDWQRRVADALKIKQTGGEQAFAEHIGSSFTDAERRRLDVFLRHPELLD